MKRFNLTLENPHDVMEAIISLKESARICGKKLEMHTKRKERRLENQCFELYRSKFYWKLSGVDGPGHQADINKISEYWSKMWETTNKTSNGYDEYLVEHLSDSIESTTFPNLKEFEDVIKYLPNWKAAGIDGIFNFFIKHISSVHKHFYDIIKDICLEKRVQADWFYQGITYLITKGNPSKGSEFRPITRMLTLTSLQLNV
ncbi:hypothetical protein TCON_1736 [Astathelohania contejeani]|uniref:Reverse transcriptase n=1 Tax=Astathelohania contejeani TaxID=164912 RepID=A0ABQ7HY16_9MICR|nr:hypothetical protein TCON_1736 [Thelohania contejeani]